MPRIRLIHWNEQEAAAYLDLLRQARHQVDYDATYRPALMKSWRESPPDAFVIDLSRLPSHGREIAVALRQSPRTRLVPLLFCAGLPAKVAAVQSILPDAAYCTLPTLTATLQTLLQHPPAQPVKPIAMMDRYGDRTAAQKLGITPSSVVALIDAPSNAAKILGELPSDVELEHQATSRAGVILCFVHQAESLPAVLSELRPCAITSKFWILWRKGGSAARGDVTEGLVRCCALDLGLVDYKICAVNTTWTAMLFARKK